MIECHPGKYEMTIITFRGETQEAGVYTSDREIACLLDEICAENPKAAQITQIKTTIPRGHTRPKVESKRYRLDKDIIQFDAKKGKPIFTEAAKPKTNNPSPEEEEPHEEEQDAPEETEEDNAPFDYDEDESA